MRWLLFATLLLTFPVMAQTPPRAAVRHRHELTRIAHAEWGLDAPIATFAAQIHQESAWNSNAISRVGARGMTQFMPGTTRWWCERRGIPAAQCLPHNPTWAMRAMVGYDKYLFERVYGNSEYDRMWAALRSYNGGLGHWRAEAWRAGSFERVRVDSACGKAKRSRVHCKENLGYPHRIIQVLQPIYDTWGRGVQP